MSKIRAIPLASGSKGNSVFVEAGGVRVLFDAGLNCKQIGLRLQQAHIDPETIEAIFVTHEHSDHISALPVLSRKYKIPVYISEAAASVRLAGGPLREQITDIRPIEAGMAVELGNIKVHPFSISHDSVDPLGFRVEVNGTALAISTDLGIVTRLVCDRLSECRAVYLESNHDPYKLRTGPYPEFLKRRITGKKGHLSNPDCRKLIENIYHPELETIVLAHLSEENNTPELAFEETQAFLDRIDAPTSLHVAHQDKISEPIILE